MFGEASGETLLWTDIKDQFGCRLVERVVVCWERARSEGMDGEGVDAERHEADEEMLSDAPGRRGGNANADEAVSGEAHAGLVVHAVLEVVANLAMQP